MMYKYNVNPKEIENILYKQLSNFWPDCFRFEIISKEIPVVLDKMYVILSSLSLIRCNNGKEVVFSPYDTVSWSVFLYYLSNELYKKKQLREATVIYYLNKVMHSVEWFYALDLPEHFFAEHPHNSVLGKAVYGDYFFCFHGTTVGANYKEDGSPVYPKLGNNVFMFANSTILGDCNIGNNVIIAANTYVKDMDIPDNSVVFSSQKMWGGVEVKQMGEEEIKKRTSGFWNWKTNQNN